MTLLGLPLQTALRRLEDAGVSRVRVLDITARRNAQAPEVRVVREACQGRAWTLTVCRFPA